MLFNSNTKSIAMELGSVFIKSNAYDALMYYKEYIAITINGKKAVFRSYDLDTCGTIYTPKSGDCMYRKQRYISSIKENV